MRAEVAEGVVIEHLAGHVSPPELIALARAELRKMRHVPDEGLTVQRERLQTGLRRLNEMYLWQTIEEGDYRAKRFDLEGKLAELPPPADSNVLAFDRAGVGPGTAGGDSAPRRTRAPGPPDPPYRRARHGGRGRGDGSPREDGSAPVLR